MTDVEKKKIVEYMNAWLLHRSRAELKKEVDKILDKYHSEWAPRTSWDPYLNLMYEIYHGVLDRDLALRYLDQIKKKASRAQLSKRAIEMPPHIYSILQDVVKIDKTIDLSDIENTNLKASDYDKIRDLSTKMKESGSEKRKDYVKQIVDLVKKKQAGVALRQMRALRRQLRIRIKKSC